MLKPLDYAVVNRYWGEAETSILGPYMMDGFGFPASAGRFRFHSESKIVKRLIRRSSAHRTGNVLDLGSGVGYWAEYFGQNFKKVVAVEASANLYEAMARRCSPYPGITPIHENVLSFEPKDRFSIIFIGGLLMYLNESDLIALLRKMKSYLNPGGIILCRETTVQNGTVTREGDYQAIYRSVPTYHSLFSKCGLSATETCLNKPYVLMQMGCESIRKWKTVAPEKLKNIPFLGKIAYWGLRLTDPWITHIPSACGIRFPELTNHFFLVRPSGSNASRRDGHPKS
ncbi:MAG: class I SAM-dependent methyltransferase [Verrucomicrobia bacterium]|nr:class I SAM-dependent methyltransferase [Verrucomicrobiota bacterium]